MPNNESSSPHYLEPFQDLESSWAKIGAEHFTDGVLSISIETEHQRDHVAFTVPTGYTIEGNSLAGALASMLGDDYRNLHFDFAVSDYALRQISDGAGGAEVTAERSCGPRVPGIRHGLSFSGGLDSLGAALLTKHDDYQLIGTDYGGWFQREVDFLESYSGLQFVVSTDFRRKRYGGWPQRSDYISTPALLVADHFSLRSLGAGLTLETDPYSLVGRRAPENVGALAAAGVRPGVLVRGCSEFLTSWLVVRHAPHVVTDSLVSIAAPQSEKQFRKALSIEMATAFFEGRQPSVAHVRPPKDTVRFGGSIYVDFAFVVLAKAFGSNALQQWVEFPESVLDEIDALSNDWIYSYHPIGFEGLDNERATSLRYGLAENGVEIYSPEQLASYNRLIDVLLEARAALGCDDVQPDRSVTT